MRHIILKVTALFITCLISTFSLLAQIKIETQVNAKKIGTEDVLVLTYAFSAPRGGVEESLPNFSGFRVVQHNKAIFNSSYEYTFHLKPIAPGKFTISELTLYDANGQVSKSKPLQIEVVKGSLIKNNQNNSQGQHNPAQQQIEKLRQQLFQQNPFAIQHLGEVEDHFFIVAQSSKDSYYIGEPIFITYKLYFNVGFSSPQLNNIPNNSNFISKNFDLEQEQEERIESYQGKNYRTIAIKKAILYGFKTGTFDVGDMSITAFVDYFGKANANTKKKSITIKPLPPTQQTFHGGVGQFAISTQYDKINASTNDPITLTITITGNGNIEAVSPPDISWPQGISVSEPTSEIIPDPSDVSINQKKYTYFITADSDTSVTIPAANWTYFDLNSNAYKTLSLAEQPISFFPAPHDADSTSTKPVMKDFSETDSDSSKSSGIGYLVISVLALVITVWLVLFYRKKKKAILQKTQPAEAEFSEENFSKPSVEKTSHPTLTEPVSNTPTQSFILPALNLHNMRNTDDGSPEDTIAYYTEYVMTYFRESGINATHLDAIESALIEKLPTDSPIISAFRNTKTAINTLKYNPLPKSSQDVNNLYNKIQRLADVINTVQ